MSEFVFQAPLGQPNVASNVVSVDAAPFPSVCLGDCVAPMGYLRRRNVADVSAIVANGETTFCTDDGTFDHAAIVQQQHVGAQARSPRYKSEEEDAIR